MILRLPQKRHSLLVFGTLVLSGCAEQNAAVSDAGVDAGSEADSSVDAKTCEESWRLAGNEVAHIQERADVTCSVDEDCVVYQAHVACNKACSTFAVSTAGKQTAQAAVAEITAEHCEASSAEATSAQGACARSLPRTCEDSSAFFAVCREGQCRAAKSGCSESCTADRIGGVCRGAEFCDGCPSVLDDALGKACEKPYQTCAEPGFCPATLECSDEESPGEFRWVKRILLCSVSP